MIPGQPALEQLYQLLPSLDETLRRPEFLALMERHPRVALVRAARAELARARAEIAQGIHTPATQHAFVERLGEAVARQASQAMLPTLIPVLNATGVILHTNLGRAPLSEQALRAIVDVAGGYSNLEFDLETGNRGRRDQHVEPLLLRALSAMVEQPAEPFEQSWSAAVVNNCAAATFLALNSLAEGGEVLVSRGELVEIGGGFRVPDIMRKAGVTLREVGTTNRTRVTDYSAAITSNTRMILRVHQSNFRIEGFTEKPDLAELIDLGSRAHLPVFEDQGTGLMVSLESVGVREESSLLDSVRKAPGLIAASGDKLLGGPQCGLLLGRRDLVDEIRANPLYRALRVDKLTYAALEATLLCYSSHKEQSIPVVRMLRIPQEDLRCRCEALQREIAASTLEIAVVPVKSVIGGGTTPGAVLNSFALSLRHCVDSPSQFLAALRRQTPPVIARVQEDRVVLDLRTVPPEMDTALAQALRNAAAEDRA
jgi:L-seryl-tRNA(Ser) seleniumtransferase